MLCRVTANYETSEHPGVTFEIGEVTGFLFHKPNGGTPWTDVFGGIHLVIEKNLVGV
jgi:hypothetical protein